MFVTKEFTFDAAHFLTDYYGKCEKMHGHTYRLQVTLEGPIQKNGLVVDFVILKLVVKKHVLRHLDHTVLNEVIENPSAENTAVWIWEQLHNLPALLQEELHDPNLTEELKKFIKEGERVPKIGGAEGKSDGDLGVLKLYEVALWETPTSGVRYRGE